MPPRTVLLLQGGGALGSYQAGAFQALHERGYHPDWVAGVSIGAINASLIAGNPPDKAIDKLTAFWHRISKSRTPLGQVPAFMPDPLQQKIGAAETILFGQPGFFRPRSPLEWMTPTGPLSYYDTQFLRTTLEELVDFDRINSKHRHMRLSVGAVQIATGNMVYFDSNMMKIGPEHIMASGALPPGFPPVAIDGEAYWDGGLVSNTPLQYFMSLEPRKNSLVFQVDLFSARGKPPTTLDEVAEREKDIRYSSRTRTGTNDATDKHNLRRHLIKFIEKLPPEMLADPVVKKLKEFACPTRIDVVQLIYRPEIPQGSQKDYQFDRTTVTQRWAEGQHDAEVTIAAAPWNEPPGHHIGMRNFDVLFKRDKLQGI